MNLPKSTSWLVLLAAMVLFVATSGAIAADTPPEAPPVSKFAPAKDLAKQVKYYMKRLEAAVETKEDYKDFVERIAKDSNTLTAIALSLGLHDTDNPYKKSAPAIIKASQELAAAKDYDAAKAAVANVKKAVDSKSADTAKLKWEKVASLEQLMLAVPAVNTQLKRNMKLRRPKRDGPKASGRAAVIAVIGQASLYHSADTSKPELVKQWYKYCEEMRDAAAEVGDVARRGDKAASRKVMAKLAESCDNCHKVFHPEAIGKEDAEE